MTVLVAVLEVMLTRLLLVMVSVRVRVQAKGRLLLVS